MPVCLLAKERERWKKFGKSWGEETKNQLKTNKKNKGPFKTKKKSIHGLGRKGSALFLNQFHHFAFLLA